jgi:hypothetical protein
MHIVWSVQITSFIIKGAEILIVTEGSSDTNILKKGLDMLYPDIADFFCFVDMKENYPFAGDDSSHQGRLSESFQSLCGLVIL